MRLRALPQTSGRGMTTTTFVLLAGDAPYAPVCRLGPISTKHKHERAWCGACYVAEGYALTGSKFAIHRRANVFSHTDDALSTMERG